MGVETPISTEAHSPFPDPQTGDPRRLAGMGSLVAAGALSAACFFIRWMVAKSDQPAKKMVETC